MTQEIADFLHEKLQPRGVAVIAEGVHFCAVMRGVNQPDGVMQTQAVVAESEEVHNQLLNLLKIYVRSLTLRVYLGIFEGWSKVR